MNVTPLLGNVRSTFGTMPLYRPDAPSRRTMSRSEREKLSYGGARFRSGAFASLVSASRLCCMRARTTCEGYVTVDANSFEATPSHAHSNAEGGTRRGAPRSVGPFGRSRVVVSALGVRVRHKRRRSYAANCNAPCDTRNTLGPRPLYRPATPSVRAICANASANPRYGRTAVGFEVAEASRFFCSCNRVFTTQMGFVARLTTRPASAALARCRWLGRCSRSCARRYRALALL